MSARLRTPAATRVVWDGQSHNNTPAPPNAMPDYTMSGLGVPYTVVAIGGTGWPALQTTASTRLYPQARPGLVDVLVMNGGQDGILNGGRTGAQVYDDAIAYRDGAVAAGFDLVLITTMPAWASAFYPITGDMTAEKDAHNALVLGNSGGFDAVADLSVAPLNDATDTTYFQFDQLHLTPVGAAAAADLVRPALLDLL